MPLFDVAIVQKEEKSERLVAGPISVIAADEKSAIGVAMIALSPLPDAVQADKLQYLVRPFSR